MRALDEVPPLSRHYGAARLAAMAVIVRGRLPAELSEEELREAATRLEESPVDGERRIRLDAEQLEAGLAWLRAGRTAYQDAALLGAPLAEDALRRKLDGPSSPCSTGCISMTSGCRRPWRTAGPFTPMVDGRKSIDCGAFAFRNEDTDLVRAWNGRLAELKRSGRLLQIIGRFGFTEDELPGNHTADEICRSA